ncbi:MULTISPECIES: co-chaperone HscB [unclassified Thalassotalea]|uniref:co-chaperone HscB n=1 Tax=unclassified Thalassotalea TaxID=2614972 RepID=UPI0010802A9B|nr:MULTISPECIES: co-chaperone HscB [unclassified Thalassotalea]NMP17364.1 co-chaperone HscB [Thalassotalea sp. Y01]QBY05188.1 co-chaperone HscB [Thalassotalea sp. HSM 43]
MDYFQLFGLEANFELDLAELSATYQALQKTVHPDRFAHSSAQEQMIAVQKSAEINDAFQTLKQPIARGEYLLTQRGVELPSEQQSFADVEFLMQQMELREMLGEVEHASDPDSALFAAQETLDIQSQSLWQQLKASIVSNSESDNKAAAETLRKLKFYQKLQIELERIEDKLFD